MKAKGLVCFTFRWDRGWTR